MITVLGIRIKVKIGKWPTQPTTGLYETQSNKIATILMGMCVTQNSIPLCRVDVGSDYEMWRILFCPNV